MLTGLGVTYATADALLGGVAGVVAGAMAFGFTRLQAALNQRGAVAGRPPRDLSSVVGVVFIVVAIGASGLWLANYS